MDGSFGTLDPYRQAQRRANRFQYRQSPEGPPQNTAALTATQPDYPTSPYPVEAPAPPQAQPNPEDNGDTYAQPYGNAGNLLASVYAAHLGGPPAEPELAQYTRNPNVQGLLQAINAVRDEGRMMRRGQRERQEEQAAAQVATPQVTTYMNLPPTYTPGPIVQQAIDRGTVGPPRPGQAPPVLQGPPVTPVPGQVADTPAPAPPGPVVPPAPQGAEMPFWVNGLDLQKLANPQSGKYYLADLQRRLDPSQGTAGLATLANADPRFKGAVFRGDNDRLWVDKDPTGMFNGVTMADLIEDFGPGGKNQWHGWGGNYGTEEWKQDQAAGYVPGSGGGIGALATLNTLPGLTPLAPTAGARTTQSPYVQAVLQYLAQQLGLTGALGGR